MWHHGYSNHMGSMGGMDGWIGFGFMGLHLIVWVLAIALIVALIRWLWMGPSAKCLRHRGGDNSNDETPATG